MNRSLLALILLLALLLGSCGNPDSSPVEDNSSKADPAPQPAPVVEPVKDPEPSVPALSDVDVSDLYDLSQPYVESNFYFGTPEPDLDPDWSTVDSNYACPSRKFSSIAEFKSHMIADYCLSENFADRLLDRMSGALYEHDGGLYVVSANRGGDITVGNEIRRDVIRESDSKIILRITHEIIDDTSGEVKVLGSFAADNVLIYEDDRWVWDDIVEYR